MARPLKIAKAQSVLTITGTAASTQAVTVSQTLSASPTGGTDSTYAGVSAGMAFVPATTVGGLTGGTTYYVKAVTGDHTFTVSSTQLSVQPQTSPTLTNTSAQTVKASVGIVDSGFNNPNGSNTSTNSTTYGVVGGNTNIYGLQTLARVCIGLAGTGTLVVESGNTTVVGTGTAFDTQLAAGSIITTTDGETIGFVDSITTDTELELVDPAAEDYTDIGFVYGTNEAGFIVRQKGKTKYLVQGGTTGLIAQCYTSNVANAAMTPNTLSVLATTAAPATVYVQSLNDYQTQLFATTVAPGSLAIGTLYTIYSAGDTNWTTLGASGNMSGITFTARATGSGTGTAVLASSSGETPSELNPDVIATFGTAYAANTYYTPSNPIVTIASA